MWLTATALPLEHLKCGLFPAPIRIFHSRSGFSVIYKYMVNRNSVAI